MMGVASVRMCNYMRPTSILSHQIAQNLYFTIELFDSNNTYICTTRHDRMNPVYSLVK
jgi:hypothetical protein